MQLIKMDQEGIINLLKSKPSSDIFQEDGLGDSQGDHLGDTTVDTHREQLAIVVASGRAKEMIDIDWTQDRVKSFSAKDVEKYFRRYEASLSSKTCDAMVDTFLELSCKTLARFLPLDSERLLKDLNENFMVKKELSMIAGRLSLKYGKYIAGFIAALLTVKNIKSSEELGEHLEKTYEKLETSFEEPVERLGEELE